MENTTPRARPGLTRVAAVLAGIAGLIWLLLLTWQLRALPAPVIFDMRGTVDTFTAQTAEQHLSDDEKARLVARFNDALTQSLAEWSNLHHRPVLVKAAVISGVDDITADIQRDISSRMRQGAG